MQTPHSASGRGLAPAAALIAMLLAGCASSGGGGGGDDPPPPDDGGSGGDEPKAQEPETDSRGYVLDDDGIPNPWKNPAAFSDPAAISAAMGLTDSEGNRAIAPTGQGLRIAVYDAEFNASHEQLTERGGGAASEQIYHDRAVPENIQEAAFSHGTHVAALAAGRYGLAPGAELDLYAATADGAEALLAPKDTDFFHDALAAETDVANFSISGVRLDDAQLDAVKDAGMVMVLSGGNHSAGLDPANGATALRLDASPGQPGGLGVLVGAMNIDYDDITSFSAHAQFASSENASTGDREVWTGSYFIAAPGHGVPSAVTDGDSADDTSIGRKSGTSMAAPIVSGTIAVMMDKWDHLTPEEITEVLFKTADRDFDAYRESIEQYRGTEYEDDMSWRAYDYEISPVFGHGRLDITEALTPQGELTVASAGTDDVDTVQTTGAALEDTQLQLGPAFGDALAGTDALEEATFVDAFGRDFPLDLSAFVAAAPKWSPPVDYGAAMGALAAAKDRHVVTDDLTGARLAISVRGSHDALGLASDHRPGVEAISARYTTPSGLELGAHQAGTDFGAPWRSQALPDDGDLLLGVSGDGYLAGWEQATALTTAVPIGERGDLRFASVRADDGITTEDTLTRADSDARATRHSLGVSTAITDTTRLHATYGLVLQDDRIFNTSGRGALAMGDGATTQTLSLGVRHDKGPFGVFAWHERGNTEIDAPAAGVIEHFDRIRTAQTAVGVDYAFGPTRTGLVYSEPLRVTDGSAGMAVPTGVAADGSVEHEHVDADLRPEGRERRLEAFVHTPLAGGIMERGSLRVNAAVRREPGNIRGASTDAFIGLIYEGRFQ